MDSTASNSIAIDKKGDDTVSTGDRLYCPWCIGLLFQDHKERKNRVVIQIDQLKKRKLATMNGLSWPAACRMCSLVHDSILALSFQIDSVQSVHLAYREPQRIESVGSVSMRLTMIGGQLSDRYTIYCIAGQTPPRQTIRYMRDPVGSWSSTAAVQWVLRRLQRCKAQHSMCALAHKQGPPMLPARVLYLPEPGQDSIEDCVRLIESRHDTGHYLCLSYCWGKSQILKTTRLNLAQHLQSIPVQSLAQTHQDAIHLTRLLGFEYLWIDALCIVQGDSGDWGREAPKMRAYYRNAEITLAASVGADSEAGLGQALTIDERGHRIESPSYPWDSSATTEVCIRRHLSHPDFYYTTWEHPDRRSPLLTRAWVYQERLLSPRYLHIGKELIWECNEKVVCECSLLSHSSSQGANLATFPKFQFQEVAQEREKQKLIHIWREMVREYTSLNISFHTDRLIAFSGIAAEFSSVGIITAHLTTPWRPYRASCG